MCARFDVLGFRFGTGRDPDRGPAAETLGGLFGQFAQLFFLLGRRELFLAAASAAPAPFLRFAELRGERRGRFGENRAVLIVDVDHFDEHGLSDGARCVLDFDQTVADDRERGRRDGKPRVNKFDRNFVAHAHLGGRQRFRIGQSDDFRALRMQRSIDANGDLALEFGFELREFALVPVLDLRADRRRRDDFDRPVAGFSVVMLVTDAANLAEGVDRDAFRRHDGSDTFARWTGAAQL